MMYMNQDDNLPYVKGQVESKSSIGTQWNNKFVVTHVGHNEGAVFLIWGVSALKCSITPLTQTKGK